MNTDAYIESKSRDVWAEWNTWCSQKAKYKDTAETYNVTIDTAYSIKDYVNKDCQ